jgi:hypothetical protein
MQGSFAMNKGRSTGFVIVEKYIAERFLFEADFSYYAVSLNRRFNPTEVQ